MIDELDIEMWDNETLVRKAKAYLKAWNASLDLTRQRDAMMFFDEKRDMWYPLDGMYDEWEAVIKRMSRASTKAARLHDEFDDRGEDVREAQAIIDGTTHHFAGK